MWSSKSPVGAKKAALELSVNGNIVTGKATAAQGGVELAGAFKDGRVKVEGNASMPIPITVAYDVTVKDGELVGDNSNGPFGTFPVKGRRTS